MTEETRKKEHSTLAKIVIPGTLTLPLIRDNTPRDRKEQSKHDLAVIAAATLDTFKALAWVGTAATGIYYTANFLAELYSSLPSASYF